MACTDWPTEDALHWTPRQREVLQLIAAGLTNGEIAERLGVSFAGAKWHVSEVISKLGVSSREEAAAYWRETHSARARMGRAMGAVVSLSALKVVTGSAAAVAVGVVAVAIVAGTIGDSGDSAVEASDGGAAQRLALPEVATPPASQGGPLANAIPPTPPADPACATDWATAVSLGSIDLGTGVTFELNGTKGPPSLPGSVCLRYRWGRTVAAGTRSLSEGTAFGWEGAWPAGYPLGCHGLQESDGSTVPLVIMLCPLASEVSYLELELDGVARRIQAEQFPASFGTDMRFALFSYETGKSRQLGYYDEAGNLLYQPLPNPPLDATPGPTITMPGPGEYERSAILSGGSFSSVGPSSYRPPLGGGVLLFQVKSTTERTLRITGHCSPEGLLDVQYADGPTDISGSGVIAVDVPPGQASCEFIIPREVHGEGSYIIRGVAP